jgi:pilus assembly protein Flp/PilA
LLGRQVIPAVARRYLGVFCTVSCFIGVDAMMNRVKSFLRREEGASLVEYTLLLVLIAVVAITAVSTLGTTVSTQMNTIEDKID